jgi:hypothetical protein
MEFRTHCAGGVHFTAITGFPGASVCGGDTGGTTSFPGSFTGGETLTGCAIGSGTGTRMILLRFFIVDSPLGTIRTSAAKIAIIIYINE